MWGLYLRLWICHSKHWIRNKTPKIKRCMHKIIEFIAWGFAAVGSGFVQLGKDLNDDIRDAALRCPGVFVSMIIIEAERKLIVDVATDVKDAVENWFVDVAEFLKDLHNAGLITEEDGVEKEVKKETMTKMARKERHDSADARRSGRVDGRTYANVAATCLKTSLDEDSNRNWSNEHGNLSPGSTPPRRSTRLSYPSPSLSPSPTNVPGSPSIQISCSNPEDPPGSGTGSEASSSTSFPAALTPSSTAFESAGHDSNLSTSSNMLHTPSVISSDNAGIYTPSNTTSSNTGEIYTLNASATTSTTGVIYTPPDSELTIDLKDLEWCATARYADTISGSKGSVTGLGGTGTGGYDSTHMDAYISGGLSMLYTPSTDTTDGEVPMDIDAPSASSPDGVHTPSSSPSASIKTSSASSSLSNPLDTPCASSSPSDAIATPYSTSSTDSEDESPPGTPTSTSSSGSDSTVIYTPPRMDDLD